jgi:hypothetical protein
VSDGTCSIAGCEAKVVARGWCSAHYQRWSNHGDPLGGKPSPSVLRAIDHDDQTRTCARCGARLPIERFDRDKNGSLGRRSKCKPCRSTQMKTWYAENQVRQRDRQRDRYADDPDRLRRQDLERYYRSKAKRIALVTEGGNRRRALMRGLPTVRGLTREALRIRHGDTCPYCRVSMDFAPPTDPTFVPDRATIEHVVPLSRGGAHDWDNVVLCCWQCNVRKNNRTPDEWGAHLVDCDPCETGGAGI